MDIQHKYIYSDEIKLNQQLTSGYPIQQIEWLLRKEGRTHEHLRQRMWEELVTVIDRQVVGDVAQESELQQIN